MRPALALQLVPVAVGARPVGEPDTGEIFSPAQEIRVVILGAYCDHCGKVQATRDGECSICGVAREHPIVELVPGEGDKASVRYPCKKITRTEWTVEDAVIIRERVDGKYDVADWHAITATELERLHSVLGQLLTDLAAKTIPY